VLHELLYKDFSDIVGDSFPLLDSPSSPGETAHGVSERVNRAAANAYSLKCSGVRSGVGTRVLAGREEGWSRRKKTRRKGIPGRCRVRP